MLADRYETFLVDLDGVVLLGERAVPGAADAIAELRDRGKTVRFVTNNSRSHRETIAATLRNCGIPAEADEIVSSGWAAAERVAERGADAAYPIAGPEIVEMVEGHGVAVRDQDVDAVLVGHDDTFGYDALRRATRLIHREDADLIAANTDGWYPTDEGIAPGTGAIVAAIEAATGAEPTVVGKPEPYLFETALDGRDPGSALMLGDNPDADVVGAERAGIDAALVTGNGEAPVTDAAVAPDWTIAGLADLFDDDLDA